LFDGLEEEDQLRTPLIILTLGLWTSFFGGYVRDQVCSQKEIMLDELKAQITAEIANFTMNMLRRVWQEIDYKWDVCRARDGAHCEAFRKLTTFPLAFKNTVFVPKLQVPEIQALFFGRLWI
jgi:hypothetical protein